MYKALAPDCIGHPIPFKESAAIAAKHGFEGIWFNLPRDSKTDISETKELLGKYNLKAAGFALPVEYRLDDATYDEGIKGLEAYIRYAKEVGMNRCITWIYPFSDTMNYQENFEFHRKRLTVSAEILKEYEMSLGLEFLGPPKLRKGVKFEFIHNLDQMMELCNAIGTNNVGLLLDVWHWDLAGQTYADFKKLPNEKSVVLAHIMDAPAGVPVDEQEDLVRCLPGSTGVLKIQDFFKGLQDIGYTGPVVAEPFAKELGEMSFEDAVIAVKTSVDKVWPK
ncbi:MAG TPA: sugar phosphate isomerase/epimerase family protein [Ruminiclostridium sp.]